MTAGLITPGSTIIIGLSGGPDSVYLLHALMDIRESQGLSLVAAHFDHEWRASSKDDVLFCRKLCTQLNVPFITKKASELTGSFKANGSQEHLGRNMRRFFLEQVRQEHNADIIALAHHQDDATETFFINLIRGTTITGMCGIPEKSGFFIRPLLGVTKKEILDYLSEHQIPYQTDPTNKSDAHLRNRIRSKVIPALDACDDRARKNILRAIKNIQETEQFLKKCTQEALNTVTSSDGQSLDLEKFFNLDPYLQKRVLVSWLSQGTNGTCRSSEAFLEEVMRFLSSPRGGGHQISPEWKIVKKSKMANLSLCL